MASPRPGKLTLLEVVQSVLNATSGDEVNSISDTVESLQVAEFSKEVYYDMISGVIDADRQGVFQLESLSDTARPNYMKIPPHVKSIEVMYYDVHTDGVVTWKPICYISPVEFIKMSMGRSTLSNATSVEDFEGTTHFILNDKEPTYFTSFDDEYVIFDSWNSAEYSTLIEARTMVVGQEIPEFVMSDTFIPDLPADKFSWYLAEVKKTCFVNLEKVSNANEERKARNQQVKHLNDRYRTRQTTNPSRNYGR